MNNADKRQLSGLEIVEQLRPMDDVFWHKLAESKEFCQEVLQVILGNLDLMVVEVTPQKSLRNVRSRSVVLDVLCKDSEEKYFNIEVQKSNDDDHQRRVRYNGSNVDTYVTEKGIEFNDLPEVYVIYLSSFDVFRKGKTIYHVDRILRETGDIVDNGFHEVYVNAAIDDHSKIADLMRILSSPNIPDDERFRVVCREIRHFKAGEGRDGMCQLLEEYVDQGKDEEKVRIATNMLKQGASSEFVVSTTGLSPDEVEQLKERIGL